MAELIITKGNPLQRGATKNGRMYNFAYECTSPQASLIISDGKGVEIYRVELDESYKTGDVFAVTLGGVSLDRYYYSYEVEGERRIDPYSKTITNCSAFGIEQENVHQSRIVLDRFDWGDDKPLHIPYEDCIFYKLHVRGFTKSRTSGVKHKGTFRGIAEKLDYLKSLGITTIELMPCYEYDESWKFSQLHVENRDNIYNSHPVKMPMNYWGYCSGFHFAPKSSFTSIADSRQDYTFEFKSLIKLLHANGIEVVMEMYFDRETPDMILDCARFWVTEYHIDGIHYYGPETALQMLFDDPVLSRTKIITVYWDKARKTVKNMASYNNGFADVARKFLKGDENQLEQFVRLSRRNSINSADINYITNHNGFTMMDLVSFDRKHNQQNGENNQDGENFNYSWNCGVEGKSRKTKVIELRQRQMKNAFIMLLFSAGTPLILAGDEFLNSQGGNNNPYCIDGETTWLNWKASPQAADMTKFVKKLIRYRQCHKILHMEKQLYASDSLSCGYPDISYHGNSAWYQGMENYNRHVGIMFCTRYDGLPHDEGYELIYIGYNMHFEEHSLALPNLPEKAVWEVRISSGTDQITVEDKYLHMPARTAVVLRARIVPEKQEMHEKPKRKGKKKND